MITLYILAPCEDGSTRWQRIEVPAHAAYYLLLVGCNVARAYNPPCITLA